MKNSLTKKISKTINRIPFYLRRRFTKKYIVFQSDDWGMKQAKSIVKLHESLWRIKRFLNGDINTIDEITRHNMMAGLIKAVIRKQKKL